MSVRCCLIVEDACNHENADADADADIRDNAAVLAK